MTTKTTNILLFASLIAVLVLPFGGMQFADATAKQESEMKQAIKENGKGYGFDFGNSGGVSSNYVAGVPSPNSGTITCSSYVTTANPCSGQGTGLGSGITLTYPSTSYFYTHLCNGGTVQCVTLKWQAEDYPNSIYDPVANDTFFWQYGTTFSCSQTWGCTNSGYWTTSNDSPHITVTDAPRFDPITTYTQLNYKSNSGQWASVSIAQDLTLGFG